MRNQFAHDYPQDSEIQAVLLSQAFDMAERLLHILDDTEQFASAYL